MDKKKLINENERRCHPPNRVKLIDINRNVAVMHLHTLDSLLYIIRFIKYNN